MDCVNRINIRLEGGLGDHLLGTRFIPAIKEKYPDAKIYAYCDTEGKKFQENALKVAYSHLFDNIQTIDKKKFKEFWVDCQFGTDNFYGALENVPDDILQDMQNNCDKFYDLHIDGLKWMNYDFDWLRYFYFFPKPKFKFKSWQKEKYVIMHLNSATSKGHILEQFYIDGLVKKVSEFIKVIIISTKDDNYLFEHLTSGNVSIFNGEIEEIFALISQASAMVSIDSGFRYIAYGCGIPTITFSANCLAPGKIPTSHMIRWLMFTNQVLPLNYSFTMVAKSIKNILENKGYSLMPFINNIDKEFVNRKYTINREKTK